MGRGEGGFWAEERQGLTYINMDLSDYCVENTLRAKAAVNPPKIFVGWWKYYPCCCDVGVIWRVGRTGSLHKMDCIDSKDARTQGKMFKDSLGKEGMLQPVQPGACEDGPGTCGQHFEISKKGTWLQASTFFLSKWVRLTCEKFLQGLGLREFE